MIRIKGKIGWLTVERIWFQYIDANEFTSGLLGYMRLSEPMNENWYTSNELSYTVLTNLCISEEELLKVMRKK